MGLSGLIGQRLRVDQHERVFGSSKTNPAGGNVLGQLVVAAGEPVLGQGIECERLCLWAVELSAAGVVHHSVEGNPFDVLLVAFAGRAESTLLGVGSGIQLALNCWLEV